MVSRTLFNGTIGLLLACSACAHAPSMGMEPSNVLIVVGTGEISAPPDIAVITLGVEHRSRDPRQAVTSVSQAMQNVISALRSAGVDQRDVQTSQLNVGMEEAPPDTLPSPPPFVVPQPVAPPQPAERPTNQGKNPAISSQPAPPPEPAPFAPVPPNVRNVLAHATSYRAALHVTVKIRNLQRVGDTLASAFAAGANSTFGLNLTWENPVPRFDKARTAAIDDARRRAVALSTVGSFRVDRVVSVSELNCGTATSGPQWFAYGVQPAPMMSPAPSVPFERGQLAANCAVRVAYAIRY